MGKIPPHSITAAKLVRWLFVILVMAGAFANHIGGRFDPLTFLLAFSILTLIRRVWLRLDLLQYVCLTAGSLFADVGWLAFSQYEIKGLPTANSLALNKLALVSTLGLLPLKLSFLMYLFIREKMV